MQTTFEFHRSERCPLLNETIGTEPGFIGPAFTAGTHCFWFQHLKAQGAKILFARWLISWIPGSYGKIQLVSMQSGSPGSSVAVATKVIAGVIERSNYHNPIVDAVDVSETIWKDLDNGLDRFYAMMMCGDNPYPLYHSVVEVVWDVPNMTKALVDQMVRDTLDRIKSSI
jgi:hypothetical protein